MTTLGETPSTGSGTIALSQAAAGNSNRPIVMPEAFSMAGSEEWDSWLSHFKAQAVKKTLLDGETSSTETVVDWYNYCQEVCANRIMNRHAGPYWRTWHNC